MLDKQFPYLIRQERDHPCQCRGVAGGEGGPFPASRLVLDSRYGGDAREIDQHEKHVAVCHQGRNGDTFGQVYILNVFLIRIENAQGTYYQFLRTYTRQESDAHLPVESQRLDDRLDGFSYLSDVRIFLLFGGGFILVMVRIVPQEPDDDGRYHDDASHFLEVLRAFLPRVACHGFCCRHAVGRKLHDERGVFSLYDELAEDTRHEHRQQDADGIEREQYQAGTAGEEGTNQYQIDGQTGTARHQRVDEHGDQTRLAALDDA